MRFLSRKIRLNVQAGTRLGETDLIRVGMYNGEEHLIVPCVALVGDHVYYGLHAEFPELVPSSELAFSLPSWAGRPIIPDHPPDGTANTPEHLDEYQYGQIFYPSFSDNRLRFELWLSPARAAIAGTTWVIEELEAGNMAELSIGASIELELISGATQSGEYYGGIWRNISGDHIAVGLGGGRGACNLDMGCGALRFMSESEMQGAQEANMANTGNHNPNSKYVRRVTGTAQAQNQVSAPAATVVPADPPANEPTASFLSSLVTRMGGMWNSVRNLIEDAGQSDWEIRTALSDAVYRVEPGFDRIIDIYQDSMTFTYSCFEWTDDQVFYRRTFTKTSAGVTISDTREEVINSGGWKTVIATSTEPVTTMATTAAKPCSCHNTNTNADTGTVQLSEGDDNMKRDEILRRLAALSDTDLEKLVTPVQTSGPSGTTATATETSAPATAAAPSQTSAPAANPPAVPAAPTTPAVPATATTPSDPATLAAAATAILGASGIDVAALNAMLAGEKARQEQSREMLITALSSRVPDLTKEILALQSTAQLEMMARAAGILGNPSAAALGLPVDYSGMGLAVPPATLSNGKKYEAPDPFNLRGGGKKEKATAAN